MHWLRALQHAVSMPMAPIMCGMAPVQVGSMTRRPRPDDLELAFINASAATSPLTKTVKFFKGFGGKK